MKEELTQLEQELLDEMLSRGYKKEFVLNVAAGLNTPEIQTAFLDWIRSGDPTEEEAGAHTEYLLICRKFGAKGTRYFLQNGEAIRNIVVKDGVIGRLWFNCEKLTLNFKPLSRDDGFRVYFYKGQSDDGSLKWSEINEREFYAQWYVEHCLWCVAPHVQDLKGQRSAFLEEIDGVIQMRKGIADDLRKILDEMKALRREHDAITTICHAESSQCNRSILREIDQEIMFLESDIQREEQNE